MNNRKGFSLIEIIIAMMIVGIVTTMATSLFVFGMQSYNTTIRQINQHDIVTEITRRIGKDIQECSKYYVDLPADNSYSELYLEFPTTPSGITPTPSAICWKSWKIKDGVLTLKVGKSISFSKLEYSNTSPTAILSNLDTSLHNDGSGNMSINSRFQATNGTLMLSLKPISTNTTIHQNKNILEPIITEYSVKYKIAFLYNEIK